MLEGDDVEVSVLFLDIRDFTAFAERASAREVVATLNRFWELVVPAVSECGGHANKFIGDGLLAVFGAPERHADHADRAVRCGIDIVRRVRTEYARRAARRRRRQLRAGRRGHDRRRRPARVHGHRRHGQHGRARRAGHADHRPATCSSRRRRCALLDADHGGFEECERVELKGKTEEVRLYAPRALALADYSTTPAATRAAATSD